MRGNSGYFGKHFLMNLQEALDLQDADVANNEMNLPPPVQESGNHSNINNTSILQDNPNRANFRKRGTREERTVQ